MNTTFSSTPTSSRRAFSRLALIGVMVPIAILSIGRCARSSLKTQTNNDPAAQATPSTEAQRAAFSARVRQLAAAAELEITQASGKYHDHYEAAFLSYSLEMINSREAAVASLTSWTACFDLTKRLAVDRIKDTNTLEEQIKATLDAKFAPSRTRLLREIASAQHTFLQATTESQNRFAAGVFGVSQALPDAQLDPKFIKVVIEQQKKELQEGVDKATRVATATTAATAGALVEAAFVRNTVAVVSRILTAAAARMGATALTAGTLAVADGPLPIGDLIGAVVGIGGGLWTAHDLYVARNQLPNELRNSLSRSTANEVVKMRGELNRWGDVQVASVRSRNERLMRECFVA